MIPSYQPETAYKIFMRAMFNRDIATGRIDLTDSYSTKGPSSTWHIKNDVLPSPESECYILEPSGCSEEEYAMVMNNTAIIENFILVGSTTGQAGEVSDTPSHGARYSPGENSQVVLDAGSDSN